MFERLFGKKSTSPLIEGAFDDISSMLRKSSEMLRLASLALFDNKPLAVDLDSMDDSVDAGERMVRRSVLEHLAFSPDRDLVTSLILVSMVQDAERVGDFARGLAGLERFARGPRSGPFCERLKALSLRLEPLFGLCETGFRRGDVETSKRVLADADAIKEEAGQVVADVAASDLAADQAVVYSGAARILSRIASHLGNIATTVFQPYDNIRHTDEEA